jgi:hypothetical protein
LGYFFIGEDGNPLLDALPQIPSFHLNERQGYAGFVQKVIQVKKDTEKKDTEPLMKIYPGSMKKENIANTCLKKVYENASLAGTIGLGDFQMLVTDTAMIWPVGDELLVRTLSKAGDECDAGVTQHIPKGHVNFYRDGKIEIVKEGDAKLKCDLKMGGGGSSAISFSNGMIVPGFDQTGIGTKKGAEYSTVFHIYIYDFARFSSDELQDTTPDVREGCAFAKGAEDNYCQNKFGADYICNKDFNRCDPKPDAKPNYQCAKTADCDKAPTGYVVVCVDGSCSYLPDLYLEWNMTMTDKNKEREINDMLEGMDGRDIIGQNGEEVHIKDGKVCIKDINGKTTCYEIVGFDPETGRYILRDPEGNVVRMGMYSQNGVPYLGFYDKDGKQIPTMPPIPISWISGLGGSMYYDKNTGQISIKNEFPFMLNPAIYNQGFGGTGWYTPGFGPMGGKEKVPTTKPFETVPTSPLAALPWAPTEIIEIVLFIMALLGALIFIRIRYSKKHT